jgi:hypothetical protein
LLSYEVNGDGSNDWTKVVFFGLEQYKENMKSIEKSILYDEKGYNTLVFS